MNYDDLFNPDCVARTRKWKLDMNETTRELVFIFCNVLLQWQKYAL